MVEGQVQYDQLSMADFEANLRDVDDQGTGQVTSVVLGLGSQLQEAIPCSREVVHSLKG